jgi:glycosyltransferase involved in cell wall biosynthesis
MLPTVLHPTAHDEPPIYLPLFDLMMRLPHAFGFLTEEEAGLVRRRFRVLRPSTVTGIGVELDASGDGAGFRSRHDLGDAPYLVYVGRIDPHKGAAELVDQFRTYKSRNRGPLKLVMVGDEVWPVPEDPDIVVTGFVSEQEKRDAIDGSLALVHPSYFESFSMALSEAWAQGKPALVQGRCEVLVGQATRSGGALPYRGFAEFEDALKVFEDDHLLVSRLARAGQHYVERRYRWDTVLTRYERFLDRTVDRATPRLTGQRASEMS